MSRHLKSQRGAIDLILIAVVAVLAIGLGGYVRYQQIQAQKTYDAAKSGVTVNKKGKSVTVKEGPAFDPTSSWTAYTSASGKFSLKYPRTWIKATCGGDSPLYLGPVKGSVAVCNSDYGGQIGVMSGDGVNQDAFTAPNYEAITSDSVVIDGGTGIRMSAVAAKNMSFDNKGTKHITYMVKKSGRSIYAYYIFDPTNKNMQDVSSDFDTMIQKTLKY